MVKKPVDHDFFMKWYFISVVSMIVICLGFLLSTVVFCV